MDLENLGPGNCPLKYLPGRILFPLVREKNKRCYFFLKPIKKNFYEAPVFPFKPSFPGQEAGRKHPVITSI